MSLTTAIANALLGERAKNKGAVIKTLIDEFRYPIHGPGMMWEKTQEKLEAAGSPVHMETKVDRIFWAPEGVTGLEAGGRRYEGDAYLSTLALRDLIDAMDPPPPAEVVAAAHQLKYRDFLTIALIVNQRDIFPDTWIYIHEPQVKLGRIQNFKNWSPYMVPDPSKSCLGLEYFCFEGDELWETPDEELVKLGTREIGELGLVDPKLVEDGSIVRMPKAYPVYDSAYPKALETIRAFLATIPNLQLSGRNGMHRYNNQDHSMLTAMLAARNLLGANYDLWQVNVDQEYHEEGREVTLDDLRNVEATQPLVPRRVGEQP